MVKSDFQTYRKFSKKLMAILRSYTELVEQASIDEAYMDVTEIIAERLQQRRSLAAEEKNIKGNTEQRTADEERKECICLADEIRRKVRETLGFTVNVGISGNKLLAKTASDFLKPDRTHTLFPDEIEKKMWPLPIGDLHGCGPASAGKLVQMGIGTIGDAAHADLRILCGTLGEKGGAYIWNSANGRGSRNVKAEREAVKGYSNETTLSEDIDRDNYEAEMPMRLRYLADKVSGRMQRDHIFAGTIGVMIKTDDFRRHSRQLKLADSTDNGDLLFEVSDLLMRQMLLGEDGIFAKGRTVRLVGISASGLDKGEYRQMSLFDPRFAEQNDAEPEKSRAEFPEQPAENMRDVWNREVQGMDSDRKDERPIHTGNIVFEGEDKRKTGEQIYPETDAGLSDSDREREDRLQEMLQKIRRKYGADALKLGKDRR